MELTRNLSDEAITLCVVSIDKTRLRNCRLRLCESRRNGRHGRIPRRKRRDESSENSARTSPEILTFTLRSRSRSRFRNEPLTGARREFEDLISRRLLWEIKWFNLVIAESSKFKKVSAILIISHSIFEQAAVSFISQTRCKTESFKFRIFLKIQAYQNFL